MFYSWDDLKDDNGDFGSQLANNARNFACRLWEQYPKNFVGDNPVSAPIKWFWNQVCEQPPLEQPPQQPDPPPFSGGQCNFRYNLFLRFNRVDLVGPSGNQECVTSADPQAHFPIDPYGNRGYFWGPIGGVKLVTFDNTNCGGFLNIQVLCHGVGSNTRLSTQQWVQVNILPGGTGSSGRLTGIAQQQVKPYPGSPSDTCGDLPPDFPDSEPPEPGEEIYNVNIKDGDDLSLEFPLIWNDVDFKIPLKFDFEVGDIHFNFDGIDLNFNPNNDWKLNNNNQSINQKFQLFLDSGGGGGGIPDLEDLDEETEEEIEEKEEENPKIEAVLIEVVSVPKKGKTIVLPNSEDNTFFAGYFSWTLNGFRGVEMPIRKKKNVYVKPSWANGFRAYTVNLAKINVSTYKSVD